MIQSILEIRKKMGIVRYHLSYWNGQYIALNDFVLREASDDSGFRKRLYERMKQVGINLIEVLEELASREDNPELNHIIDSIYSLLQLYVRQQYIWWYPLDLFTTFNASKNGLGLEFEPIVEVNLIDKLTIIPQSRIMIWLNQPYALHLPEITRQRILYWRDKQYPQILTSLLNAYNI